MPSTFTRQGSAGPLYVLGASLPPDIGSYTVAFLPDQDASTLPATLTLTDTWQTHPGTYLFLAGVPQAPSAFAAALAAYRASPAGAGVRFVWLSNPDDPLSNWQMSRLAVTGQAGAWITTGLGQVALRNLSVWVGGGCVLTLNDTADGLVFTPPGANGIYLTAAGGAATLDDLTSPLTVSFADKTAGCLLFSAALDNTGSTRPPDVEQLDVGFRYFVDAPSPPDVAVGGLSTWDAVSYRFPLLQPLPATLALAVSLDPLNPLLISRTLFGVPSGTQLATALLTTTGRPLTLQAGADPNYPSGFGLAVRVLSVPGRSSDPYSLVPSGAFGLLELNPANGQAGPPLLMCGGSGVEYLTLSAVAGSVIYFFPGQKAYAPPAIGGGAPGLAAGATTSWAYIVGPEASGPVYHAQPDAATLYQPLGANGGPAALLGYMELAGTSLPAALTLTGDGPTMFPLVPLGALTGDIASASQLELQAISPARRAAIAAIFQQVQAQHALAGAPAMPRPLLANPQASTTQATTPQGLLATITDGVMSLLLGQSQGGSHTLVLGSMQPDLADAFQANQLFLVATDMTALGQLATISLATGALTISANASDTWTFDVFSQQWDTLESALILKFAGKSLLDLLSDTGTWALGSTLNGGNQGAVTSVQQRLIAFVQDAVTRAKTEPDFVPFATLAVDPSWNGILVLNCDVPLDGLPEQISGIAVGIDANTFRAHHLGLTVTPVTASGTSLTPHDSSLFGLVYYDDPGYIVGTNDPYRFKVNTLKVLFANSAVVSFSSTIDLLVNALFGDPVTLSNGTTALMLTAGPDEDAPPTADDQKGNNLLLQGVYQRQGTTSSYVFSTDADSLFTATSGIIDAVELVRVQFVTVLPADQAEQQGKLALSRFLLLGNMRFKPLPFDLFSYGNSADHAFQGSLSFSNLAIDLTYDPKNAAATSAYTFDATRIALDVPASTPRPGSLFQSFPLKLTGLIQALPPDPGDKSASPTTPASLGYLGVDVIGLPQGALNPPWFGLVADLGLGSAGALAAQAGFTATLLAAWAPGLQPNVGVGLKLPGTGGAKKLLSLESVLKLKIQDIQLATSGKTYVLNLRNIKLSLLSLSFPPSGQTELALFADPSGQDHTTLGWYAAYAKDAPKKKSPPAGPPAARALPPGGSR